MADKKARYAPSTAQVDLEDRQKRHNESSARVVRGDDAPLSENGYVGVDTVYQNAANDTEVPRKVEKGPEAKVFNEFLSDDVEYPEVGTESEEDDAQTEPTPPPTGTGTTSTPPSGNKPDGDKNK